MNSIEEESTFFISIEKKNIKKQTPNFKNIKSKYFYQSIKTKKYPKKHNSSVSFPNNKISNEQLNKTPTVTNTIHQIKKISKINIMKKYLPNENKSNSFILSNKNKNNNKSQNIIDIEENIDIEDTDEYNDIKFNININKPKLAIYNRNQNVKVNKSSMVSRNIFKNYLNKSYNNQSQIVKIKKNNNFYYKNYSYSFENKDLLKLKLNQNISILNSKIDMLKNLIKRRNIQILLLQLFFEKNNMHRKIKKNDLKFDKKSEEMRKEIFNLKILKSKCQEKFIKKDILEKEINKQNFINATKKVQLIEKILDSKMLINSKKNEYEYNTNNNIINNNEESTIVNDSLFFDNESNVLETKENLNLSENKTAQLKNKKIMNKEDEDLKKNNNNNEINCIRNKNMANYFVPRFLIETKTYHKNKNKNKSNHNSKFNIFISSNNGK